MASGVAWLFPGQGSQIVGMGRELAERYVGAARAFEEAGDALRFDLRALCWSGPQTDLDRTANTQPALLTASIAALRAAEEAAGALPLASAVVLVRRRGELMQEADPSGGMLAVIGLDAGAITTAIAGTGLVVANDNAPGQVVISGPKVGFERATAALRDAGAKRVIPLRASAAFHSPAMRPVGPELAKAIRATPFATLRYPVVANVDAQVHEHAADFASLLERQVWSPVQWVACMRRAHGEGATAFVEFGPATVLTGLAKRILPEARTANVSDVKTLEEALTVLR